MLSFYQILQVEETATDSEIKQAYRKLSKILHPDLNNNTSEANTMFRLLNQAYEVLSDPIKRKNYDTKPIPSTSDNTRVESYKKQNEKQGKALKDYELKLKDYKEELYLSSQRERALTKEVDGLKARILEHEMNTAEKTEVVEEEYIIQEKAISTNQKGISRSKLILIILVVNLVLFLSYLAAGYAFSFFF